MTTQCSFNQRLCSLPSPETSKEIPLYIKKIVEKILGYPPEEQKYKTYKTGDRDITRISFTPQFIRWIRILDPYLVKIFDLFNNNVNGIIGNSNTFCCEILSYYKENKSFDLKELKTLYENIYNNLSQHWENILLKEFKEQEIQIMKFDDSEEDWVIYKKDSPEENEKEILENFISRFLFERVSPSVKLARNIWNNGTLYLAIKKKFLKEFEEKIFPLPKYTHRE